MFRIREEAVLSRFVDVIGESPDQAREFARGLDYVDFRVYDEEHWELDENRRIASGGLRLPHVLTPRAKIDAKAERP